MKFQNKVLWTSVALLALSGPTWAADLIVPEPPPAPPIIVSAYDWTGPYIGVQGGYGWAELEEVAGADLFTGQDSIDLDGGFLGVYAGYNAQWDQLLLGIEADVNRAWINGDFIWGGDLPGSAEIDWFGSLRARLGFVSDRTLLFGTVGFAAVNTNIEVPIVSASDSKTLTGWTAGLGVEHAFRENWLARAEYRYYDVGDRTFFGGTNLESDLALTMHTISLGLAYRF